MSAEIAIIGATGINAQPWTDAFLAAGWRVKTLTRDPRQVATRRGRTAAFLDLDDAATFTPALAHVDVLALITPAGPSQVARELALIAAAKQAAVGAILKLSVIGADLVAPISPFARWSAAIEQALAAARQPHILLRANAFMQNLLRQRAGIAAGAFVEPLGATSASYVDVRDIADVAVAVAQDPFDGRVLTLTGPVALTGAEIAATLAAAVGRSVEFVSPDLVAFEKTLRARNLPAWQTDAFVELYAAIAAGRAPHLAIVSPDVAIATGRPARTLQQFASEVLAPQAAHSN